MWYAERTKIRYNAVDRIFYDAIIFDRLDFIRFLPSVEMTGSTLLLILQEPLLMPLMGI
ncbi:MAG: hypothetical protein HY885_09220 [Deltaproteobacteria bacterium]|nr:hypothetical protein [Deltaproteobacteria bacterium]